MFRNAINAHLFHWESQNTTTTGVGDPATLPQPPRGA
jgi:hypothetical protein